ncbi:hypothetical protein Goklo_012685 [Gossypium klotzschianum]|uniref:Uncharacterized protein n=1 Tax=Gossypium klotzschianum TaxID=34286 RepID=A0A7J8VDH6_9ROSI|nr:hypothetical protein [Gossypium klotzschianum]
MENNLWKEGNEQVKEIVLRSGEILNNLTNLTLDDAKDDIEGSPEKPQEFDQEPEPKEIIESATKPKERVKGTTNNTQLANTSAIQSKRVLEDMLVKVRSFIVPVNFVVLDFEKDREMPILLGRPFLATSRATIDLEKNELTMRINGETKTFRCESHQSEENQRKLGEQLVDKCEKRNKWEHDDGTVQEFYASLRDHESRNTDDHILDIVSVRGIEVKVTLRIICDSFNASYYNEDFIDEINLEYFRNIDMDNIISYLTEGRGEWKYRPGKTISRSPIIRQTCLGLPHPDRKKKKNESEKEGEGDGSDKMDDVDDD